jgi:hypothetical protein
VSVGIAVAKAAVEVEANVPSSFSLAAIAGNILSSMHLIIVYIALALEIKGVSGV